MKGGETPRKRHTPEQVINKLREAEVALGQGEHSSRGQTLDWGHRTDLLPVAQWVRRARD